MNIFCTCSSDVKTRGSYEDHIGNAGHKVVSGDARALLGADALFICISGKENRDVKEDLNLALDRGLPVAYVIEVGGVPDSGLSIQLAIATRIPAESGNEAAPGSPAEGGNEAEPGSPAEGGNEAAPGLPAEKNERFTTGGKNERFTAGGENERFETGKDNESAQRTKKAVQKWLEAVSAGIVADKKRKKIRTVLCAVVIIVLLAGAGVLATTLMNRNDTGTSQHPLTIQEQLGIDIEALKKSEKIDLSGKGLEDISFLSGCKECKELDISGNAISDISVLSELENIRVLNISGNRINDINVLLTLKNLEEVDIRDNPIRDYTATSFLGSVVIQ